MTGNLKCFVIFSVNSTRPRWCCRVGSGGQGRMGGPARGSSWGTRGGTGVCCVQRLTLSEARAEWHGVGCCTLCLRMAQAQRPAAVWTRCLLRRRCKPSSENLDWRQAALLRGNGDGWPDGWVLNFLFWPIYLDFSCWKFDALFRLVAEKIIK